MTHSKLYLAMLVLFTPAVALAHPGGGNGNGGGGGHGNAGVGSSANVHGKDVSAEAAFARSANDGRSVGADVSAVARSKSRGHGHAYANGHYKTHTKGIRKDNHGAAVSAEAHLAKSENDGDSVGADVSEVAKSNSVGRGNATAKGHSKIHK